MRLLLLALAAAALAGCSTQRQLRIVTDPPGATVWVNRKDLAPRGETPFELALPEGSHQLFVERQRK